MTDVSFDQTRNRTLHQHMSHESKFKGSVGLTNTGAGVLKLETKVIRRYAKISQSQRRPLIGAAIRQYKTLC